MITVNDEVTKRLISGQISDGELKDLMFDFFAFIPGGFKPDILSLTLFSNDFQVALDSMYEYVAANGVQFTDEQLHALNERMFGLLQSQEAFLPLDSHFHDVMLRYEYFRNPSEALKHFKQAQAKNVEDFRKHLERPIDYFKYQKIKEFYEPAIHKNFLLDWHFFTVYGDKLEDESLQGLNGRALKTAILIKFKDILDGASTPRALEQAKKYIEKLPEYKILSTHQDFSLGSKTASIIALENIIKEKEQQITPYKGLKGDKLNMAIVDDFKKIIANASTIDNLKLAEKYIKESPEYKTLITPHSFKDRFLSMLGHKTILMQDLEHFIKDRKEELEPKSPQFKQ